MLQGQQQLLSEPTSSYGGSATSLQSEELQIPHYITEYLDAFREGRVGKKSPKKKSRQNRLVQIHFLDVQLDDYVFATGQKWVIYDQPRLIITPFYGNVTQKVMPYLAANIVALHTRLGKSDIHALRQLESYNRRSEAPLTPELLKALFKQKIQERNAGTLQVYATKRWGKMDCSLWDEEEFNKERGRMAGEIRQRITCDAIYVATQQLEAEGKTVTPAAVKAICGKSLRTILKNWEQVTGDDILQDRREAAKEARAEGSRKKAETKAQATQQAIVQAIRQLQSEGKKPLQKEVEKLVDVKLRMIKTHWKSDAVQKALEVTSAPETASWTWKNDVGVTFSFGEGVVTGCWEDFAFEFAFTSGNLELLQEITPYYIINQKKPPYVR